MPSRIERLTIKWLLRVALLGTITFAVWGSLSSWYPQKASLQQATRPAEDATNDMPEYAEAINASVPGKERGNALVVVSLKSEDTSWLGGLLEEWERLIYVVDGEALKEGAKLRIPKNKGREGMVYLSFIIDNYDNLPNVTLFLHSARYQWHNDDPLYDGIPILQNLRVDYIKAEGYANLRCGWTLGCPSEIQPGRKIDNERTETYYSDAFQILFPNEEVPEVVGIGCCAQSVVLPLMNSMTREHTFLTVLFFIRFAATKSQIRKRPQSDYVRFRKWLLETPLEDYVSGRIMEYSWHMILGKPAVHCPPAGDCYCKTFGYCNLTCTEGSCEGRYILPPLSTMPKGWPRIGWHGEDTGRS